MSRFSTARLRLFTNLLALALLNAGCSKEPVYIVNLLQFNEWATYADGRDTDLRGRDAYEMHISAEHPQRFHGSEVYVSDIAEITTSGGAQWDRISILQFPSRKLYEKMLADSKYQASSAHRDAALDRSSVLLADLTMSSTIDKDKLDGAPEPEESPGAFDFIQFLEFKEKADYPESSPFSEEDLAGWEAYDRYDELTVPVLISFVGAKPRGYFSIDEVLSGDSPEWDELRLTTLSSQSELNLFRFIENNPQLLGAFFGAELDVGEVLDLHASAGLIEEQRLIGQAPEVSNLPLLDTWQPWRFYLSTNLLANDPYEAAATFSNWELVMPVQTISRSKHPRKFERDLFDPGQVFYEFNGVTKSIADYIQDANLAGLMAMHDGKVRLEEYGFGIDANSRFHIWSATKSYTGTLIGMALHEGRINSLDDQVADYAPQFEGTAYGEASIRHLLMMSSGVDFHHTGVPRLLTEDGKPWREDMYWDIVQRGMPLDDWAAVLPERVPDGTDFNYLATDTHVLSAVLRAVYHMPLGKILQKKIWKPAGFGGDATWSQNEAGSEGAAFGHCCLSMRLQEFAHLGQLYLEDLEIDGKPTVPSDWIQMVSEPQADFQEPNPGGTGYSFQFWIPDGYDQEFVALGAFDQYLWVDYARGFTVAQFAVGGGVSWGEFVVAMRAIGDALTN